MKHLGNLTDDNDIVIQKQLGDLVDDLEDGTIVPAYSGNIKGEQYDNTAEFLFRPTADTTDIEDGTASLKSVKGNTIVWNQLVQNGNFADGTTGFHGRQTGSIEVVEQKLRLYAKTTAGTNAFYINCEIIKGHTYYFSMVSDASYAIGSTSRVSTISSASYTALERIADDWNVKSLFTATEDAGRIYFSMGNCTQEDIDEGRYRVVSSIQFFDLTLMFGAGNEPATVEEFEKLFPYSYYAYNAGELLSLKMTGIETVGFNQWDEEWELGAYDGGVPIPVYTHCRNKHKVNVIEGQTYYIKGKNVFLFAYRADGSYIGMIGGAKTNTTFTPPPGTAYINFYFYQQTSVSNVCINLSHSGSRNGEYHPYEKHTLSLDVTSLTSNGSVIFPDGMKSAGTVHDELTGVVNGAFTKAVKRVGQVDLGALTWTQPSSQAYGYTYFRANASSKGIAKDSGKNIVCSKYIAYFASTRPQIDKFVNGTGLLAYYTINIIDSGYSTPAELKTSLDGVIAYFKLENPIEYELDIPIPCDYKVSDWGTEKVLPEGVDASGVPATAPFRADIHYGINVADTIKNLPHQYRRNDVQDAIDRMLLPLANEGHTAYGYFSDGKLPFSSISGTPTTLDGYGISDAVKKSGDTITGSIVMNGHTFTVPFVRNFTLTGDSNWERKLAVFRVDGTPRFFIGAYGNYVAGAEDNGISHAFIGCNDYGGLNLRISKTYLRWGTDDIYHAGNSNLTSVAWKCSSLTMSGALSGATTGAFSGNVDIGGRINLTASGASNAYISAAENYIILNLGNRSFIVCNKNENAVRRESARPEIMLGTDTYPWASVYSKDFHIKGSANSDAYLTADGAHNCWFNANGKTLTVWNGTENAIRPAKTNTTVTLGTSDTPWGGIYSTTGNFSGALSAGTIKVSSTSQASHLEFSRNGANYIIIPNDSSASLNFGYASTAAGTLIRLTQAGALGLGTTSPTSKMDIYDAGAECTLSVRTGTNTGTSSIVFQRGTATDGYVDFKISNSGAFIISERHSSSSWTDLLKVSYTGDVSIGYDITATPAEKLVVGGNIVASGQVTAGQASDVRLKANITAIARATDILSSLRPVEFDWNDLAESKCSMLKGHDVGLIAQEVENLIPSSVTPIFREYKRLDYTKVTPYLIAGWQDHESRIAALEAEIERLKNENETLRRIA